jgi:hypothetical protein
MPGNPSVFVCSVIVFAFVLPVILRAIPDVALAQL